MNRKTIEIIVGGIIMYIVWNMLPEFIKNWVIAY